MKNQKIRFAFAGDRDIAVWVLKFILEQGFRPEFLLLSSPKKASHGTELRQLCDFLDDSKIMRGTEFKLPENIQRLKAAQLDYIFGIHFPYLIPKEVLDIPEIGVLNLHPAYLPYNRGWHTPSWAILENTPIGATLHFMEEELDSGDIILQKELKVLPHDTADSLYARLKQLELEVFKEAWPYLKNKEVPRQKQDISVGTYHVKQDLFHETIQKLDLNSSTQIGSLLRKLRALTTNNPKEAAYFYENGEKYFVQIKIIPEKEIE